GPRSVREQEEGVPRVAGLVGEPADKDVDCQHDEQRRGVDDADLVRADAAVDEPDAEIDGGYPRSRENGEVENAGAKLGRKAERLVGHGGWMLRARNPPGASLRRLRKKDKPPERRYAPAIRSPAAP